MIANSPIRPTAADLRPTALRHVTESQQFTVPLLMELFDFTPGECKIASLMMRGNAVDAIAATMGLREATIRNHLKRMY